MSSKNQLNYTQMYLDLLIDWVDQHLSYQKEQNNNRPKICVKIGFQKVWLLKGPKGSPVLSSLSVIEVSLCIVTALFHLISSCPTDYHHKHGRILYIEHKRTNGILNIEIKRLKISKYWLSKFSFIFFKFPLYNERTQWEAFLLS